MKNAYAIAVVLAVVGATTAARAQTPADLTDLVGARGSSGETQMQARGYEQVRATQVHDQSWTFWWSDVQNQCVSISTSDGRYASISKVPSQNCNPGGDPGGRPGPSDSSPLTLICYGSGQHPAYKPRESYQWNSERKRYDYTTSMEVGSESFSSDVQVEIQGDSGRVHLSGNLIPPLHSGGHDGWWDLHDLRVSRDRITATYRLSALNKANLDIDRRSGTIRIGDMPSFSGHCDSGDWGSGRRF